MQISAVLFDRDGTVIYDKDYLSDPAGVELIPGVGEAMGGLKNAGIAAYLVSNQSGIGRGYFPESAWYACQKRLDELLEAFGANLEDARFCPHDPKDDCHCRKPSTGMWESLRQAHSLVPEHCVMVGDKTEDLRFGVNAGLAVSVLVLSGKGMESAAKLGLDTDVILSRGFVPFENKEMQRPAGTRLFAASDAGAAIRGILSLLG